MGYFIFSHTEVLASVLQLTGVGGELESAVIVEDDVDARSGSVRHSRDGLCVGEVVYGAVR